MDDMEEALDIRWPTIAQINVASIRRQTGPGLIWNRVGAVADIYLDGVEPQGILTLWEKHARRILDALGWSAEHIATRQFAGGVNLAISAPMDQLYSAVFAAQTAWHFCASELAGDTPLSFETMIADLKSVMAREANPALLALIDAAHAHHVDVLCDEDDVSIGHGAGSKCWPITDLPQLDNINWSEIHDVPSAFITGTNGKTTTTRLCAAIATEAGKVVGLTSTDMVQVGREVLDRGDYSGPAGGRMVLRDPRVEVAYLEVARGGILRRGLPTSHARVAVVTNIAKDHLGEYGVMTLPELAEAKFTVARAIAPNGILVLNADDSVVVTVAQQIEAPKWWFSLDQGCQLIRDAKAAGTPCAYATNDALIFHDGTREILDVPLDDVPMTLNGAAKHNIRNALAAIATSIAMDMPLGAIHAGLLAFRSDPADNPGRLNEFSYNGARVFVDYAHNPHSIAAVCDALAAVPAKRRFLMISQPGDRSDQDIGEAAKTATGFKPDHVVIAEIADYLRGRTLGESPTLLAASLTASGINSDAVQHAASPTLGATAILAQLQPDDLALLLVLSDRDHVFKLLA